MSSAPPDRSLDLLAGRVFDIPEPQFIDLVRSLEARRLRTDQRTTADAVLSRLRPRMSLARPPRRPTPQRLFCLPFEDLLYDPGTPRKAVGRIPRSTIASVWTLFAKHSTAGVIETTATILKAAEADDTTAMLEAGAPLWAEGARVLKEIDTVARKAPNGRTVLCDTLGGEPVLSAMEDMVATLGIALPLLRLRAALPSAPIDAVGKDGIAAIVATLKEAAAINREAIPYVLFVLMARLRDLGALGGLLERLTEAGAGDLLQVARGQAAEAVVSQSEDRLVDVRAELADEDLPKAEVARALGREIDALERAAKAVGDGRAFTRRIDRVKAELAAVAHDIVVSGADEATLAVVAALDDPVATAEEEHQRMRDAEDRIVALRLCRRFSAGVGMTDAMGSVMAAITRGLDDRGKSIVDRLNANDPTISVVDLYNTVRLVELAEGPEKADTLRRAGMKAMKG